MSDRGMNGKEPNNVLLMVRVNPASVLLDEIAYRELEVRLHFQSQLDEMYRSIMMP